MNYLRKKKKKKTVSQRRCRNNVTRCVLCTHIRCRSRTAPEHQHQYVLLLLLLLRVRTCVIIYYENVIYARKRYLSPCVRDEKAPLMHIKRHVQFRKRYVRTVVVYLHRTGACGHACTLRVMYVLCFAEINAFGRIVTGLPPRKHKMALASPKRFSAVPVPRRVIVPAESAKPWLRGGAQRQRMRGV